MDVTLKKIPVLILLVDSIFVLFHTQIIFLIQFDQALDLVDILGLWLHFLHRFLVLLHLDSKYVFLFVTYIFILMTFRQAFLLTGICEWRNRGWPTLSIEGLIMCRNILISFEISFATLFIILLGKDAHFRISFLDRPWCFDSWCLQRQEILIDIKRQVIGILVF